MTPPALLLGAWLFGADGAPPPPLVNVCWDYGCDRSERLMVPPDAWAEIRDLLREPPPDPAAERTLVATAIARFEAALGPRTGTDADLRGNFAGSGQPGQLDCIDESRNTTGYLHVLAERGLLHWHDVGERRKRAPWLFDQHWTAVLVDHSDGGRWAIDSWPLDNGLRPHVQALDAWLDGDDPPPNPDA